MIDAFSPQPDSKDFFATKHAPYDIFSAQEWASFKADTYLTLTEDEINRLRSLGDPIDLEEVKTIYLSLSRLLSSHLEASQALYRERHHFLDMKDSVKTPFIIGIAGSVAVGKSTTARILKELLQRWPSSPKVDLLTTDGFLYPNHILQEQNKMDRKGFPDSYNITALLKVLSTIKSGISHVQAPIYSHLSYDILPDCFITIDRPDILIVEGLNVLQVNFPAPDGKAVPFVSDFFDFSIYMDAKIHDLHHWYQTRFLKLKETAFQNPHSYFHRFAHISTREALQIADNLWQNINLKNLEENILPTRSRASLVLHKGSHHKIEQIALRKL